MKKKLHKIRLKSNKNKNFEILLILILFLSKMIILYNNAMHISESELLRNALKKNSSNSKYSTYKQEKTPFSASWNLLFRNRYGCNPPSHSQSLFCEEDHIMVFKCRKSLSPRTKVIAQKSITCVCLEVRWQRRQTHNICPPNFCSRIKTG